MILTLKHYNQLHCYYSQLTSDTTVICYYYTSMLPLLETFLECDIA